MPPTKVDKNVVLVSIFLALDGLFAYSAFLPSIMTVHTFVDTPMKVKTIRQGELVGTIFLLILGALTSYIMKSWYPFLFAIMGGVIALGIYEFSLRQSPAFQMGGLA